MIRVRALSAGPRAETGRFTGTVHSVFARACNVALDDGRLLALVAAEVGNAPRAVRLDTPPGFAFDAVLTAGERVGCRAGVLRGAGGGLAVRLAQARAWRLELDGRRTDLARPEVRAAWRATRCELQTARAAHRVPGTEGGVPARPALDLWWAARRLDAPGGVRAMRALIGRGPGLTPAGDDTVVGFLAGLRASRRARAGEDRLLAALGDVLGRESERTNRISAAQLLDAAAGHFAEPLARLAVAIASGAAPDEVRAAARDALAVGATSGADGTGGLLLGLAAWGRTRSALEAPQ